MALPSGVSWWLKKDDVQCIDYPSWNVLSLHSGILTFVSAPRQPVSRALQIPSCICTPLPSLPSLFLSEKDMVTWFSRHMETGEGGQV